MYVEEHFVTLLSSRLRNFKKKGPHLYNMSCPFCGDSKRHTRKARGYIYAKGSNLNFICHRCGIGMSASNFIKKIDDGLWQEMRLARYRDKQQFTEQPEPIYKPKKKKQSVVQKGLVPIEDLSADHPALLYAQKRNLPLEELFWIEKFHTWAAKLEPDRFKIPPRDEGRLMVPLKSPSGAITGFQGRLISGEGVKYLSVKINDQEPLIWGRDRLRKGRQIFVFEGPFDAMFIPNAIACCGGDITMELVNMNLPKDQFVVVYDNEPRSKHTIKKMQKAIDKKFPICIWPSTIREKDINEMINSRIERGEDIGEASYNVWFIIKNNIYSGLAAEIALYSYKKI